MNVRPIPNELLGNTLTLILPEPTGTTETPVENVRVERSEEMIRHNTSSPAAETCITVWVDRHNSTWLDFPVGARVRYENELYEITEQKVFYADGAHHCRFRAKKNGGA